MLGLYKRRKQKQQKQVIDCLRSIEDAILRRVVLIIQERGAESSENLPRSVVNKLLGRTNVSNGAESGVAEQIARDLVARDEEIRNAVFISLQASLGVEGENKNFDAERRIMETILWLKDFGEIPSTSHDYETLMALAERLRKNIELAACRPENIN